MTAYIPDQLIIDRYANVLVNFALNSGDGVKAGEVVECVVPDVAKPLALALQNALLKAGAQPMIRLLPTGFERDYFSLANDQQLTFFPEANLRSKSELLDHQIVIIADVDPYELADVDPAKIMLSRDSKKQYRDWLTDKETAGHFTWTIGLWGVEAKAATVGQSIEEYWAQIIQACFLDQEDPVAEWRKVRQQQIRILQQLNALSIEYLMVKGEDVELKVTLGADRIWEGGSGRNIPSFEFFTSPNWQGVEGWIRFNQPVYRYGQVMKDIELTFEAGKVVKAHAAEGDALLLQMLKTENADKVGEFSLTDKRMSRITHVMAETLFDENIGGPFGNTHLALGMAFKDCYRGDQSRLTKDEWEAKGFNDSAEHTDIISTTDRTVTAFLTNGEQKIVYQDGQFTLE